MDTFGAEHVSLVTGAGTGIGAATAIALARGGSSIAVHYKSSAGEAASVVERSSARWRTGICLPSRSFPSGRSGWPCGWRSRTLQTDRCFGQQCGSMLGRKLFHEISDAFWMEMMETNLFSVMRVTRAAAPHMTARRSGVIINVSSVAARNGGSPGVMPYAAAKDAVLCMTKPLAKELIPHGVRVNGVNPGVIATPFHE